MRMFTKVLQKHKLVNIKPQDKKINKAIKTIECNKIHSPNH